MTVVKVQEAKTQLSRLLTLVEAGEEALPSQSTG
jgi:antitoxin (DNA-binding transcriptional repressor) of toxin-antitoxin stability system